MPFGAEECEHSQGDRAEECLQASLRAAGERDDKVKMGQIV